MKKLDLWEIRMMQSRQSKSADQMLMTMNNSQMKGKMIMMRKRKRMMNRRCN